MRQWIRVVLIASALFYPLSAFALEADYHEQLTQRALLHYKTCQQHFPNQLKAIHASNALIVAQASGDIDRISLFHVRRSLSRLWNWHFYDAGLADDVNPQISIKPNWAHINRSLHRTFVEKVILASQRRDLNDKEFFILSGEVLHFVQDMGVPAHVAPIYHDSFKKDDFDEYDLKSVHQKAEGKDIVNALVKQCGVFIHDHHSPEKTLMDLAENTRKAIVEKIATGSDQSWTLFWSLSSRDAGHDGFYNYGVCDNTFDPGNYHRDRQLQVCQVETSDINAFYRARYQQMLQASLRVLVFLNRK